jgi:outer membrane biosynthesis protein TonB
VQNWRFAPARRGGSAVAGIAEVPVNFRLTD